MLRPRSKPPIEAHVLDLKRFHRKLEKVFAGLQSRKSGERMAALFIPRVLDHLGPVLGLRACQLYERRGARVRLSRHWGQDAPNLATELSKRLASSDADGIRELPWAGATAGGVAGVLPLHPNGTLLATLFTADSAAGHEAIRELGAALSALDYALTQHLRRRELEDLLDQARAIQLSLLPPGRHTFGDFDIAAVCAPAESVGGDLYDFIPLDDESLCIVVADASGHGFPAALQARDVMTGLRMGMAREFKITRTVEKLNRIIHRSGLVTRFVSLVFGELEADGNFVYVNAGHPPPLLLDGGGIRELTVGGMVLGPIADVRYARGLAHLERGSLLALYTDGVVERAAPGGEQFGTERIKAWMEAWREGPGDGAVEDLVQRLKGFGEGAPFEDDVTVVFVRRPR